MLIFKIKDDFCYLKGSDKKSRREKKRREKEKEKKKEEKRERGRKRERSSIPCLRSPVMVMSRTGSG